MTAKEILTEWLSQTDQTNLKEGHYFVIEEAMKEFAKQFKEKADKWDALDEEIGKFYEENDEDLDLPGSEYEDDYGDNNNHSLIEIGEICAIRLGYL